MYKETETELLKKCLGIHEEKESHEDIAKELMGTNPLSEYSTTQLKKELQRRKKSGEYSRSGRKHIKDSTELSGGHLW